MTARVTHYNTRYRIELSPKQREVLDLIERGKTNFEIAQALGVSLEGAKYHVSEILAKLEVSSREEAVRSWRDYNRPAARLQRAFPGAAAIPLMPIVIGATAIAVAVAVVLAVAALAGGNSGNDPANGAVDPSSTATPSVSPAASPAPATVTASTIPAPTSATTSAETPFAPTSTAGASATTTTVSQPVCLQHAADAFRESGGLVPASGTAPSAIPSGRVDNIRFAAHDGCERVVIDLAGDFGVESSVEFLREFGVVRVTLPDADTTGVTDKEFGGSLARSAFVVRSQEGISVDIHLATPATAAVTLLDSPTRVVIDLKPGGGPIGAASFSPRMVVLTPSDGYSTIPPIAIRGYARAFEANVVTRVRAMPFDDVIYQDNTTATDWTVMWGEFSLEIPDLPSAVVTSPQGVELFVGELSARDGSEEGVTIRLDPD